MSDMTRLRERLDVIDQTVMRLLEERFEISLDVGAFKQANALPILDVTREAQILRRAKAHGTAVEQVYQTLLMLSRQCQENAP